MIENDREINFGSSPERIGISKPSIVAATPLFLDEITASFIGMISSTPFAIPESFPENDNEMVARIGEVEIALVGPTDLKMSGDVLRRCSSLRYILVCGTNTAGIDKEVAQAQGITVDNVTGYCEPTTALWIFDQLEQLQDMNRVKTLGIIGFGPMGQEMARQGKEYGLDVVCYTPTKKSTEAEQGATYRELSELLRESDIISIHVPKDTKVLGPEEFSLIKDGAVLVDTSMGNVFEVDDFLRWIQRGRNRAIFDRIVSPEYHQAFQRIPNVLLFDEIAAYSSGQTLLRLSKNVVGKLIEYLLNKQMSELLKHWNLE